MRYAGTSSWSTRQSLDPDLHRLLYVRQALVGRAGMPLDPPALCHRPPAVDVPAEQLPGALAEWGRWWRAVLALIALRHGHEVPSTDPALGWAKELCPLDATLEEAGTMSRHRLTDPVLSAVAHRVEMDARRWMNTHKEEVTRDVGGDLDAVRRGSPPWAVTREVAEDVAFDRGVDPGRVNATVLLIDVEDDAGTWWHEVAPGAVLCSYDAALHPTTARVMLRHAFTARL